MKNQRKINQKIAEKNTEIMKLLKEIEESLYPCCGNNNYGHVGSTEHVLEELKSIKNFICS